MTGCSSSGGATPTTGESATDAGLSANGTLGSSIAGAAPVEMIQGDWATACVAENSLLYLMRRFSVNGSSLTQTLSWFSDPECTVSQPVGLLLNGSTVQANGVSVPTGATVSTTLGDAVAVDFYFDVPTIDYAPVPEALIGLDGFVEEVLYDILLVNENKLYFGDIDSVPERDGSTPQTRPVSLNFQFEFSRVQ